MSRCIKDLYSYDLIKKCSKCEIISSKSNFHKNKNMNDGLYNQCKFCRKKYYTKNREKTKKYYIDNRDRIKEYDLRNHDKTIARKKIYFSKRHNQDINFRLIHITTCRIRQALSGKLKLSSTREILGIDINLYKKWIEYQFTPEMNWSNFEIDHVKQVCMFNVSDDEELKHAFNWGNTQPLLKEVHSQKGVKFNFFRLSITIH